MDAFLRELRERVHIGVVGGSDYAKIAEQLGEGDEGKRGGRGLPGGTCAQNAAPEAALGVAGRAQAGAAAWLPLPECGGQAGMLRSMLPAPILGCRLDLYELPQSSDSFTPCWQFSPPCCSVVGSPQVPPQVPLRVPLMLLTFRWGHGVE